MFVEVEKMDGQTHSSIPMLFQASNLVLDGFT